MNAETLIKLYSGMLWVRLVEERIAEHYQEQQMRCPVHLSIGQEAVAVGVCAHLSPDDYVMSGHRSHGHYLAKGGDLNAMMAELYGKVTGCSKGKGGSMHLVDLSVGFIGATPIVASTIPIGVGASWGAVMQGKSLVTVVFFGEGATEEGVFHESVNFALLKKLPVLFVCENNLYSVYSPLHVRQPSKRTTVDLARGHGVESYRGDGNDCLQVYQMAGDAVKKIRNGGGPIFVEFATYRWREHCGPNYDNHIGYRTEEEFLMWKERCPLKRLRTQLLNDNIVAEAELDRMADVFSKRIDDAVQFAKSSPFPAQDLLMKHVYSD